MRANLNFLFGCKVRVARNFCGGPIRWSQRAGGEKNGRLEPAGARMLQARRLVRECGNCYGVRGEGSGDGIGRVWCG
jgi:hypothetical protein